MEVYELYIAQCSHKQKAAVSHGIWQFCCHKPRNFANWQKFSTENYGP